MAFTLDNFVRSILAVDAAIGDTSLVVALAAPPLRDPPAPSAGAPGILILQDQPTAPTKIEIVTYTGVSIVGTQVTLTGVTRGLEGTSPQAWPVGTQTFSGSTAAVLAQFALAANLGTAAEHDVGDFATAAQGAAADSALQPGDVGSAAYQPAGAFATAAQGAKADNALPNTGGVVNGVVTINQPGASGYGLAIVGGTAAGAEIKLTGNGTTTPSKSIAVQSGSLNVNSDSGTNLLYLTDAGALGIAGGFTFGAGNTIFNSAGQSIYKSASLGGHVFQNVNGNLASITAYNFSGYSSGTNTGDQDLSGLMPKSGGAFTGAVSAPNLSGTNTGDQVVSRGGAANGRIFVQSADPGAAAADGDVWVW